MGIEKLKQKNLNSVITLIHQIFNYEDHNLEAEEAVRDSLEFEKLNTIFTNNKKQSKIYRDAKQKYKKIASGEKTDMSNYWVYTEGGEIAGLSGITWFFNDYGRAWLGWFFVNSKFRGRGIGKQLMDFTLLRAKKLGFKKLRIWTSTLPQEKTAQKLYDKYGFKIYSQEKFLASENGTPEHIELLREKKL